MSVWNVYRPLVNPHISEQKINKLIQLNVWVIGIIATLIALQVKSIYILWSLCSDFVYCLLFPALVCALFDKKANMYGALVGFAVAALLRFGGGDTALGIPVFIPFPTIDAAIEWADGVRVAVLFPYKTTAMLSGLLTTWLVSRFTQRWQPARGLVVMAD